MLATYRLRSIVLLLSLVAAGCDGAPVRPDGAEPVAVASVSEALTVSDCPAGYHVVQGTNNADTLTGTSGNDCIIGLGGNDVIHGGGGNDFIAGGNGDDQIYGEGGADQLFGEGGVDTIEGGDGNDSISGGVGVDTIHGGANDDVIHGDDGGDFLYGDDGDDVVDGDANADSIWGGNGDDVLYGDAANDILRGEAGDDALIGGAGTNTSDGGPGSDACSGANCEKPELPLSGCTQSSQCSSGNHCIADFGLCIGCVSDRDADHVCDSKDGCPTDASKTMPGVCGCGVADTDSDGDQTLNCNDGCPNDAAKVAPGACGCGVADTDSDGDHTPNCTDGCPTDALKTAPGACGCGVAETDSDGDHTPNCTDGCPSDPTKVAPGACGCGVPDTDGDGVCDPQDICPAGDDHQDTDSDGTPNACDLTPIGCVAGASGAAIVSGNLVVDGTDTAGDLAQLAGKVCVTGNLTVNATTLTDLSGLAALREIGAALTVGNFATAGNPQLTSLHGLEQFAHAGSVLIANNYALTSVAALTGLRKVDSSLSLRSNSALTSLNGLQNLTTVASVSINGSNQLTDLAGLSGISGQLSSLVIDSNYGLTSLNGLQGVTRVTGLLLVWGGRLQSFSALSALTSIGTLELAHINETQSLSGLESVSAVTWALKIHDNPKLNSLAGLNPAALTGLSNQITIYNNPMLLPCAITTLLAQTAVSCTACTGNDTHVCNCPGMGGDSDGDGTCNASDPCPSDPAKIAPGACGCGVADTDGDGDGTANCNDGCPSDAGKVSAGVCGCGVADTDGDGDGAANCNDACASDPWKTAPGACGCGIADTDSDGDGAANCNDACASDPLKLAPGACGCGIADTDSDGDGTVNCNDACASDPLKTAPGVCGCGVSDADTDGDGTANCNDACASDPLKLAPGVCGCGVSDADTDGDGAANCHDACPADAGKVAAGVCGCGVPDTDSDGDGVMNCVDVCATGDDHQDSDHDGTPDACDTATANFTPIAEATFENLDGVAGFEHVVQTGVVRSAGAAFNNGIIEVRRAVFEFDLSSLPRGAHITSAKLDLTPAGASYTPPGWQLQIWGYEADGAIAAADAQSENTLLATPTIASAVPFNLDVNAIGNLFAHGPMVGVLLHASVESTNVGSIDVYGAGGSSPLRLQVTYYIDCAGTPDSDGDGVCDAADRCPGSDVADGDGDGVPDGCDACPSDALKTTAGSCGCGVAETDTDHDGTADCVDACPNDNPNDSDGDGVCNSTDLCPGFDDHLDSDGDGIPNNCDPCSSAADCNDGKSCTIDICQLSGCVHPSAPSGQACSSGGVCDASAACVHTVDLPVMSRATAIDSTNDGVFESLQSGVTDPWVRRISFQGIFLTQRGLIEWNAAMLPANATLRTVELRASLTQTKGPGLIQIRGYAGDGVANLADAFAGPVVDATFSTSGGLSPVINLLTPAQGWLAAGRTIWGMNLRGADEAASASVDERAVFGFSSPFLTRLVVVYAAE